ncbi:hypothetical protein GE061_012827 [Apolygus lucorum]|uniref:Uncharacterized protein n=1 Tax=Apolygus lucorum TaxID=248454 RepID=A0A8S9XXG8_APOLU|nr:hypothetical protein GE061_012827 [Apolygus lucorum]
MDLKISLYVAACGGLPLSDIHPSPPAISSESNRIENATLLSVNDSIPPPESLLAMLKPREGQVFSTRTYSVLKWLVLGLKEPKISYVEPGTYQDILKLPSPDSQIAIEPEPEAIFSLKPHTLSTLGQEWASRTCYEDTLFAFLPCKVEYLHCLIYKGLVSNGLESDGSLLLYTDLKHCLNIATSEWTWGKSMLGINIKVIAVVEYVDSCLTVQHEERTQSDSLVGNENLYFTYLQ